MKSKFILAKPCALNANHRVGDFCSGESILDDWLKQRAMKNLALGATRTYVCCPESSVEVVGYYSLAMGHIAREEVCGALRRNMPGLIPSVLLARLAVDKRLQGRGVGKSLLLDAVNRTLAASAIVAARTVIVHPLSENAERFYRSNGFRELPSDALNTLVLDLVKWDRA